MLLILNISRCSVCICNLCMFVSGLYFQPEDLTLCIFVSVLSRGMLGCYLQAFALSRDLLLT